LQTFLQFEKTKCKKDLIGMNVVDTFSEHLSLVRRTLGEEEKALLYLAFDPDSKCVISVTKTSILNIT
jgi:hypothetical protein